MMETFCVCCGAEMDRDWQISTPLEASVCDACSIELDAARVATRLDEVEAIESLRLFG